MTGKYLKLASFVGLLILVSAAVGVAQQPNRIKATVPFEFRAGDTLYPAGEYIVTYPLKIRAVALLSTREGAGLEFLSVTGCDRAVKTEQPYLLFRRYGRDNFLAQIGEAGFGPSLRLSMSKAERETVRQLTDLDGGKKAKDIILAARQE